MFFNTEGIAQREELDNRRKANIKRRRIILFSILGALLLFILFLLLYNFTDIMFGVSEDLESAPNNGDWVMFHRDQAHTGSTGADESIDGELKWIFTAGGAIHSSPAVVNGVVYVGSRDEYLYALNAKTGEQIWTFRTGSWVDSSPIVVDGVVYCGSNDGHLYAIDAATGTELWRFQTRYGVRSSPAYAGGRVYFGTDDHHIYALDAKTGKELWNHEVDEVILSSPAVTKGIVVVGSLDGSFYAFGATNGRLRLDFRSVASIGSSPAVNDGVAYFTNSTGYLYAVDVTAKNWFLENKLIVYWRTLWLYGIAPEPPATSGFLWSINLGTFGTNVSSSVVLLDDILYLGSNNSMISMNLSDKTINWKFYATDWVISTPAVTDDVIYFGSNDRHLYALDRATGVKLWDYLTGGIITSSPAVADGMVYVGSEDGTLYAFD
jgi:outer membrane protein assembly factor BamB